MKITCLTTANISNALLLSLFLLSASFTVNLKCSAAADSTISDFPHGFLFGVSTSAYQIEGAYLEDGKTLNNWDVFCRLDGAIADGSNGDVADDHYHRYMEDIEIMHSLGLSAYRFSISWSRVLPRGRLGEVNQAGIQFYNRLIDNLLLRGIEPFVTIHHHDYPQELLDRFGGWLSPLMQEEFVRFAEVCFENFSDRVKYWMTINELNLVADMAYIRGVYPPGRCSPPFGNCAAGNSDVEPLVAVHNMLLAHGKAAKLFREQYKSRRNGVMSIAVSTFMYYPLTESEHDKEAVNRVLAFVVAWSLDPVVFGDYPAEMKHYLGNALPSFTSEEKLLLKESIDFIGINHYGSLYAKDCIHSSCHCNESSCVEGSNRPIRGFVYTTGERNGVLIGDRTGVPRFFVVPRGMEDITNYIKDRYNNMPMYITENGYSVPPDEYDDYKHDVKRVLFHRSYLAHLAQSIRNGADVRGYFIWSLIDNFEWNGGYSTKFGLYHIDRENGTLDRIPKVSSIWFREFLSNGISVNTKNRISLKKRDSLELQSQ